MADLQALIRAIDELAADELEQLYDYMAQRRQNVRAWVVPQENLAKVSEIALKIQEDSAALSDDEINAVIDDALAEVRHERSTNTSGH